MPETLEQSQQKAYAKGQQVKQAHLQQQRVLTDEAITILAADFAQVSLFQAHHYLTVLDAHERAGVCIQAFQEGYKAR